MSEERAAREAAWYVATLVNRVKYPRISEIVEQAVKHALGKEAKKQIEFDDMPTIPRDREEKPFVSWTKQQKMKSAPKGWDEVETSVEEAPSLSNVKNKFEIKLKGEK